MSAILRARWLAPVCDVLLAGSLVLGVAFEPLAFAHATAIVLVVQAFALPRQDALLRLALAVGASSLGAAMHAVPLADAGIQIPFVYGISGLVIVLSETLRRSRGALERLALYDSLTELPNRVLFTERLHAALEERAPRRSPLAVLLLDLDRFKDVNDTFGHPAGDLLLKEVAAAFARVTRSRDLVARLGGDEFAVLMRDASREDARALAERLLVALERPFTVEDQPLSVGASVGIALSPADGTDGQVLLRRADVAMYVAKRSEGSFAFYDAALDENEAGRLVLLADLRAAIDAGSLSLHYQPQVDAVSAAVVGVEALLRWQHPTRGPIPPSEFIPLAERTGLIRRVSDWVLAEAIAQCGRWRAEGIAIPVSVNVSMRDLLDPRLPETLERMVREAMLSPDGLTIEITEGALVADERLAAENVARLRALGVRVSIDDFGTGYSSLAYLHRLAAHEVKIDRSLVTGMMATERSKAIVRTTIELAHSLGFVVVAEGVEDDDTWRWLRALGCDRLQGYVIAKPMPADALEDWLRGWTRASERGSGLVIDLAAVRSTPVA